MRKASIANPPLDRGITIAAAIIALLGLLGFAGWLAYGDDFYMTMIDTIIAWCT
jgi:hypothetical protein